MDGVWSRAGASGTPQTAQAAQAGPPRCVGALLSLSLHLSLRLPPLLSSPPSTHSPSSPFSLPTSFPLFPTCLSSICQTLWWQSASVLITWLVCSCLFPLLIFSLLPLHILFLICYSPLIPVPFPLFALFSLPPCHDCRVVWLSHVNEEGSSSSIVLFPLHSCPLLFRWKSCIVHDWYSYICPFILCDKDCPSA